MHPSPTSRLRRALGCQTKDFSKFDKIALIELVVAGGGRQSEWGSNPAGAEPRAPAVPRSAARGSPAGSFVLSTAEGMLQHCREAVQPCPSAGDPCCHSGLGLSLQRSSCYREAGKEPGTQTQTDPGTRNIQAGDARAPPKEQHKGALRVSLVSDRTATQRVVVTTTRLLLH